MIEYEGLFGKSIGKPRRIAELVREDHEVEGETAPPKRGEAGAPGRPSAVGLPRLFRGTG